MEDPFVELVNRARMALVAPRSIKPAAVHLLESHPRCVPELANLVRAGNFTETSRWLEARRPSHVDRAIIVSIERALNEKLRRGATRPSRAADAPAPPYGGRHSAAAAVRSRPWTPQPPRPTVPHTVGRTVVSARGVVEALTPFHVRTDDVQRWVAPPDRLDLVRPLPALEPGTDETSRWRQDVRDQKWVCPWPACPHPELILRVGEVRVPHVAHISIRGHGADADWLALTLATLQRMAGAKAEVLNNSPIVVRIGATPFVLASSAWNARIAPVVQAAGRIAGRPPVLVVRASRLPARVVPIEVHGESRLRWGLRASRDLADGLVGAAHVLAAPDPPDDDVDVPHHRTDVPVWGTRWLGLGVEADDSRRRLIWRGFDLSPVVALDLDDDRARRVVRAIVKHDEDPDVTTLGAADTTDREPLGRVVEGVLIGDAGPRVYCHWCRAEQTVADGLSDADFDRLLTGLTDDEASDLLEKHTVEFGIYEACPRCGGPVHIE